MTARSSSGGSRRAGCVRVGFGLAASPMGISLMLASVTLADRLGEFRLLFGVLGFLMILPVAVGVLVLLMPTREEEETEVDEWM